MAEHDPILAFFTDVRDTHVSGIGVKETSYYPYLANLFNALGKTLKPKVRCIVHPHSIGAGLPDGALVTPDQKSEENDPLAAGLIPSRGVLEIKSPADDAEEVAGSEQVAKYLATYGLVLVTNLRDFILVGRVLGKITQLERFTIADTEKEFWKVISNPTKLTETIGASLSEYLLRVLLHKAPLTMPKEVAWFLASYARDAQARIESKASLPGLASLRAALEQALGLKFTDKEGEHFFRSSLVQTLFYGVFSAWVLWSKRPTTKPKDQFNWYEAAWSLHVPMIKTLFEQLATPTKLQSLGLEEVLNWTETALNRVERDVFFANFEQQHAVQYFYEPFLAAFDPELRKRMGVWFTRPEIVKYMVTRIDQVLRNEMGITRGFADPHVFVLDPSCGTGAFLVEVLTHIDAQLKEEGADALSSHDVKTAAMERIFGFELLPAPFVVAHLQLGLLLQDLGAPLSPNFNERVGVYLTNSLTGWSPDKGAKQNFIWPELEEEKDAAELVKREKKILVVLGNPPYYAFSGVSPEEEEGLVEPYKKGLVTEWKIRKFNLDELYVRFLRLAERRIAEMSKRGIVCYVSSYSYLNDPSFVVVRKRFLSEFQHVWIDCLNGDSRETGKRTPDGEPDPSVFSTEYNKAGIRLGTAIGLFAKTGEEETQAVVRYRDFWGADKRSALVKTLEDEKNFDDQYQLANPHRDNRFSFRPTKPGLVYQLWPMVTELASVEPISGLQEMRRGALLAHDKTTLEERMESYFDPSVDWHTFAALRTGLSKPAGAFDPPKARGKIQAATTFDKKKIVRYAILPLDNRWAYHSAVSPLWNRPRPELLAQQPKDESFLVIRRFAERPREGKPGYLTSALPDYHLLRPNVVAIPLRLATALPESTEASGEQGSLYAGVHESPEIANLSIAARSYIASLTDKNSDDEPALGRAIWLHALATTYSPLYLSDNDAGVRSDLPRIPLPATLDALMKSADLGASVGKLLDTDKPAIGVTGGKVRKELAFLGRITGPSGLSLEVTAGWGRLQGEDVVMPGVGLTKPRGFTDVEKQAMAEGAAELGLELEDVLSIWGESAVDVYLNGESFWDAVPAAVWEYTIGGYLVLKKWLSYRDLSILGRALTKDETREFTQMVRRIAALLLLDPALDANYLAVKSDLYAWPREVDEREQLPGGTEVSV
ncbi:MAG: type ISP restriction/modification enzyme [Terriglobia bacterium]|nr:type ISP restriction/modification enzyme [Terriglobia bacterium]